MSKRSALHFRALRFARNGNNREGVAAIVGIVVVDIARTIDIPTVIGVAPVRTRTLTTPARYTHGYTMNTNVTSSLVFQELFLPNIQSDDSAI